MQANDSLQSRAHSEQSPQSTIVSYIQALSTVDSEQFLEESYASQVKYASIDKDTVPDIFSQQLTIEISLN